MSETSLIPPVAGGRWWASPWVEGLRADYQRVFVEAWSPYFGALLVAMLAVALMASGLFWGVFGGLRLWGDYLNSLLGLGPVLGISADLDSPLMHRISDPGAEISRLTLPLSKSASRSRLRSLVDLRPAMVVGALQVQRFGSFAITTPSPRPSPRGGEGDRLDRTPPSFPGGSAACDGGGRVARLTIRRLRDHRPLTLPSPPLGGQGVPFTSAPLHRDVARVQALDQHQIAPPRAMGTSFQVASSRASARDGRVAG